MIDTNIVVRLILTQLIYSSIPRFQCSYSVLCFPLSLVQFHVPLHQWYETFLNTGNLHLHDTYFSRKPSQCASHNFLRLNQGHLGSRCTKKTLTKSTSLNQLKIYLHEKHWKTTWVLSFFVLWTILCSSTQGQWYLQIKYCPRRFLLIFRSKYCHIIIEYHRSSRYFHESHKTYIFI